MKAQLKTQPRIHKKTYLANLLLVLLFSFNLCSLALAATTLKATLAVTGVTQSRQNTMDPSLAGYRDCKTFQGTVHNNTIWLTPTASNGSGRYQHTLVWRLGSAYEGYNGFEKQMEAVVADGDSYGIDLPSLRDDVPFIQQSVLLITRDLHTGESITAEKVFTVSRTVVLTQSGAPELVAKNCFDRYPAYESTVGVLSNGTTNPSQLSIKQGINKLWESTTGTSWGFYISPLSIIAFGGFSFGNLISFDKNYFTYISKQTNETFEVSSEYQLSPGDYIQIYTQRTRYVTQYDATVVDACGATQTYPGAYQLQWWGFAYHALPLNPFDHSKPNADNIGALPMNTCPKELTPDFGSSSNAFYQTNL